MDAALSGLHDVCPPFEYQTLATRVRVVDVCDGDTVRVNACFTSPETRGDVIGSSGFYSTRVRLRGINAAETKSTNPAELAMALRAKDRLIQLVTGCATIADAAALRQTGRDAVRCALTTNATVCLADLADVGMDKYGRVLADVRLPEPVGSLSDLLLREGLVRPWVS